MPALIARILLRYAIGALLLKAGADAATANTFTNDPNVVQVAIAAVEFIIGTGGAWLVEHWTIVARRLGWVT